MSFFSPFNRNGRPFLFVSSREKKPTHAMILPMFPKGADWAAGNATSKVGPEQEFLDVQRVNSCGKAKSKLCTMACRRSKLEVI